MPGAPPGYPPGAEALPPGTPYPPAEYGPEGMPPEAIAGAPPEGVEAPAKKRSPVIIIALMVVAVLVIGTFVYLVFLRGGGEKKAAPEASPAAPRTQAPATGGPGAPGGAVTPTAGPAASPYPSLDPGLQADIAESFQQYSARNPFRCTFACPVPATTTTGTSGTSGSTTGGTSASPSPSPQGGTTSGTQQPSSGGSSVTLKEIIGGNKAVVQVSGQTYTVGVGETFAGNYKLTRIAGNCASFVQGDSPFTLCTGQSVLK
jgi:hypothetical protein